MVRTAGLRPGFPHTFVIITTNLATLAAFSLFESAPRGLVVPSTPPAQSFGFALGQISANCDLDDHAVAVDVAAASVCLANGQQWSARNSRRLDISASDLIALASSRALA